MIRIDQLPPIKTATEFFDADKVLFIDILDMSGASSKVRHLALKNGAITLSGKVYGPIYLHGSSENLIRNATKGVVQRLGQYALIYSFDGNLDSALKGDQILRFDQYYSEPKPYNFAYQDGFWENFLAQSNR